MKHQIALATVFTFCSLLASSIEGVQANDALGAELPDYTMKQYPIASTFVWFSSVEVGVCYSPQARLAGIKGALHCNFQEKYDIDNNTWTLPQTCVALKPLGDPLSTAVRDACANAKGTFNPIVPAQSNTEGTQVYNKIQQQDGSAGSAGPNDPQLPQPTESEDQDGKEGKDDKKGGFFGLFGR